MIYNYLELIPDEKIDTFYNQIKRCIDEKISYDHYIKNLKKINNNKIPEKIKNLLK